MTAFVNKHLLSLIAVLCVMPGMTAPALAQSSGQGGGNIFTQPGSSNQAPGFTEGGPGSRMRRLGGREQFPDFRQVRNLPDLTPDQRKQIQQVMEQSKQQMAPIREQMQALRQKNGQGGGEQQLMGNPDTREKFVDLRRQMREARKQSWEQMKKVLTEKQVQELQEMRQGQMQPSTFNPPMAGNGAWRGRRFQGGQLGAPGQSAPGQQAPGQQPDSGQDQPMPNSSDN
ncbi:MAG TPA: Spy/CpxP family protein refolding chaperone [Candidatus Obscuribacterales bacterium]